MLQAAERLHCPPWELDEGGDPPAVWYWRSQTAQGELYAAQQERQWQADRKARMNKAMGR